MIDNRRIVLGVAAIGALLTIGACNLPAQGICRSCNPTISELTPYIGPEGAGGVYTPGNGALTKTVAYTAQGARIATLAGYGEYATYYRCIEGTLGETVYAPQNVYVWAQFYTPLIGATFYQEEDDGHATIVPGVCSSGLRWDWYNALISQTWDTGPTNYVRFSC
jgi:hypothetical protein